MPDIQLSGGEVSMIKALGFTGTAISGEVLMGRMGEISEPDFMNLLRGLILQGLVEGDKEYFHKIDEVRESHYHVNPQYARDLRDAVFEHLRPGAHRRRRRRQ
jgi:hypothetical protein